MYVFVHTCFLLFMFLCTHTSSLPCFCAHKLPVCHAFVHTFFFFFFFAHTYFLFVMFLCTHASFLSCFCAHTFPFCHVFVRIHFLFVMILHTHTSFLSYFVRPYFLLVKFNMVKELDMGIRKVVPYPRFVLLIHARTKMGLLNIS